MHNKETTQYFSKWEECWVYFKDSLGNRYAPNSFEIKKHQELKYKLR